MKSQKLFKTSLFTILNIFILIFSIDQLNHAIHDKPAMLYMLIISVTTFLGFVSLHASYTLLNDRRACSYGN